MALEWHTRSSYFCLCFSRSKVQVRLCVPRIVLFSNLSHYIMLANKCTAALLKVFLSLKGLLPPRKIFWTKFRRVRNAMNLGRQTVFHLRVPLTSFSSDFAYGTHLIMPPFLGKSTILEIIANIRLLS